MAKLFWNKEKTGASFSVLKKLAKQRLDFVLIGGWAVYYYTRQQESLDVDIAIRYDNIDFFREFGVSDYEGRKIKYSIVDGIYVDLFLTEFSDKELLIPISEVMKSYNTIDGIKVVKKEHLLLLKLSGYFRTDEMKVRKDIIDVVSLLIFGGMDMKLVADLISKYRIEKRKGTDILLEYLDKGETLIDFIGVEINEYREFKKKCKEEIRSIAERE